MANPILPAHLHIPDPEAHLMPDGRLYVYGSWDQLDTEIFCSREYRVFSTADLQDWTDHGVSMNSRQVGWVLDDKAPKYPAFDFSRPSSFLKKMVADAMAKSGGKFVPPQYPKDMLFAPDALHYKGRYYLFFCMADNSEGVAVADRPGGPFRDPVQLPCGGIDPAVFCDSDGKVYFYWGQFAASGVQLTEDLTDFVPGTRVDNLLTEEQHFFHEGSSIRKRGDTYYLVFACMARGKPTSLGYATSKSPLGPYSYQGIVIDNDGSDPANWNNHGSIEELNGQWYVFYHRSSRGLQTRRRVCVEPIAFDSEGRIAEVKMTTQGSGRPLSLGQPLEGWRACGLKGQAQIGPMTGNPHREGLRALAEGDEAVFRYVDWAFAPTVFSVDATGTGRIELFLDENQTPLAEARLEEGRLVSTSVNLPLGHHEVRLRFTAIDGLELFSITLN